MIAPGQQMLILLFALGTLGCAVEPDWTRPDAGGFRLNVDRADCTRQADSLARTRSTFGRRAPADTARDLYLACMRGKGWREESAPRDDTAGTAPGVLARPGTLFGFGRTFTLPPGFSPIGNERGALGPARHSSHTFAGPDRQTLTVSFQHNPEGFGPGEPASPTGAVLYDRGRLETKKGVIRWASFAHKTPGSLAAGFSALCPLDGDRRLVVAAGAPLPADQNDPPPGLTLTPAGAAHMERFTAIWKLRLVQMLP